MLAVQMKRGCLLTIAAVVVIALLIVGSVVRYHSRRFEACATELGAAVRSGKTFEAYAQDPRPDGLWGKRYSRQQRGEFLAEVTWAHTDKDGADIAAMSNRAHTSAIFLFGDMVYVLFFDDQDRLREFVCLSN